MLCESSAKAEKWYGKALPGYMTLEATFILLLTFTVILFLFYAGIYNYDKCVIKQNAYIAAKDKVKYHCAENADRVPALSKENFEELSKDSYVGLSYDYQVEYVGSIQRKAAVSLSGHMEVPVKAYEKLFPADGWDIQETVESGCRDPVYLLRFCRRIIRKKQNQ